MTRYQVAVRLKKLFSILPAFKGRYRLMLLANKFLNDDRDHMLTDFDDNLLFNVSMSSHIERHVFWTGYYEIDLAKILKNVIKKDFICFDIGANVGVHSLLMAKYAFDGHVYCFEPFTPVRERLKINLAANGFSNVTVFPWAVGEVSEKMDLYTPILGSDNYGQSSTIKKDYLGASIKIDVKSIDDVKELNELLRVDFIKIDVEGSESIVLNSLSSLIIKHKPIIIFEYDPNTWRNDLNDVLAILQLNNYLHYAIESGMHQFKNSSEISSKTLTNILCVPQLIGIK